MNVRERVFERWLASGDGLTFEEWRVAQRERITQQRQQQQMARRFANQFPNPLQVPNAFGFQRGYAALAQQSPQPSVLSGLVGILGGVAGGLGR